MAVLPSLVVVYVMVALRSSTAEPAPQALLCQTVCARGETVQATATGCQCVSDDQNIHRMRSKRSPEESDESAVRQKRSAADGDDDDELFRNSVFRWGKRSGDGDGSANKVTGGGNSATAGQHPEGIADSGPGNDNYGLAKRIPLSQLVPLETFDGTHALKRIFRWGKRSEGDSDRSQPSRVFRWGKRGGERDSGYEYPETASVFRWGKRSEDAIVPSVFRWGKRDATQDLDKREHERLAPSVFRWGKREAEGDWDKRESERIAPSVFRWGKREAGGDWEKRPVFRWGKRFDKDGLLDELRTVYHWPVKRLRGPEISNSRPQRTSVFRWGK